MHANRWMLCIAVLLGSCTNPPSKPVPEGKDAGSDTEDTDSAAGSDTPDADGITGEDAEYRDADVAHVDAEVDARDAPGVEALEADLAGPDDATDANEASDTYDPDLDTAAETDSGCVPVCGGDECGSDGCGGTCGECTGGKVCRMGKCECLPESYRACCGQAVCWFDSCGAQGLWIVDCPDGCESGRCLNCERDCSGGGQCGEDGCGGLCGQCLPGACSGLAWTAAQSCVDGLCVGGGGIVPCDDGNGCTRDDCDPRSGCVHRAESDTTVCADGTCADSMWTKPRTCAGGQCVEGGGTLACSDGNPCTDDGCDSKAGCVFTSNLRPCDDTDPCTEGDACSNGRCVGGAARTCDDHNPCTTDTCVPQSGCQSINVGDGTPCGAGTCSGLAFTAGSSCRAGACTPGGSSIDCSDGVGCTLDGCDPATGCTHDLSAGWCRIEGACRQAGDVAGKCRECKPSTNPDAWTYVSGKACDDGEPCTREDVCIAGGSGDTGCQGTPYSCDDGLACTTDLCDGAGGCTHTVQAGTCRIGGACHGEGQPNPSNACQVCATATSSSAWTTMEEGAPCGGGTCSGLIFTFAGTCVSGQCSGGGTTRDCSDGRSCTTDTCTPGLGCASTLQASSCLIGGQCYHDGELNPSNTCQTCNSAAAATAWSAADDGLSCGAGSCSSLTWTRPRTCLSGQCTEGGAKVSCSDGRACTSDACSPKSGCTNVLDSGSCLIGGECFANLAPDPANACQACTTAKSTSTWTPIADGNSCGSGQTCHQGRCKECATSCTGLQCGLDGCGGTCGTCTGGKVCELGQCRTPATCGGTTCPELAGFAVTCNVEQKCEYAHPNATGWRVWDVWIFLPPGAFTMGSPTTEEGHSVYEEPAHQVTFANGFFIAKYEATVDAYEACYAEGKCDRQSSEPTTNTLANGKSGHPQNDLSWEAAGAFCRWAGGRRPSEAEWEYAASGPVHRKYPWGDTPAPTCDNRLAHTVECGSGSVPGTVPVGSSTGTSWCGAREMGGNVWELMEDRHRETYVGAPSDGGPWLGWTSMGAWIVRGGGILTSVEATRTSARHGSMGHYLADGVRCVRDLPVACGNVECPPLPGYRASCNARQHCEYRNLYLEPNAGGPRAGDRVIWVPPETVWMGANRDGSQCPSNAPDATAEADEVPCHEVHVPGFWIGRHEVTTADFTECVNARVCTAPATGGQCNYGVAGRERHPINCVGFQRARDYCEDWERARLCTESEWERAARGADGRQYPWGAGAPTCQSAVMSEGGAGCGAGTTAAIESKADGASAVGALDMAGNVYEWVEDYYHSTYTGAPTNGSAWVSPTGSSRVARGGAYDSGAADLRASFRYEFNPSGTFPNVGVRCCRSW